MKPIPLNNAKKDRRYKAIMVVLLTCASLLATQPKTATGVAITLSTVPFILMGLLRFRLWWDLRFGGGKLLTLVLIGVFFVFFYFNSLYL